MSAMIIIGVVGLLVFVILGVSIWYLTSKKDDSESPAPGPARSPGTSPYQSLVSSAKTLLSGEVDLMSATTPTQVATKTIGVNTSGPVTYSLSFWVKPGPNVAANGWPCVFLRGDANTNQTNRCPGIWFKSGTRQLMSLHSGATNIHDNGPTTSALSASKYSHIVVVIASNVMKVYINGTLDQTYTATDPFVWGSSDNGWINPGTVTAADQVPGNWMFPNDALNVKKYYWWNSALAASDVAILYSGGSSSPSSTSTYMPEPFTGDKAFAGY